MHHREHGGHGGFRGETLWVLLCGRHPRDSSRGTGYGVQGAGYERLGAGCGLQVAGFRLRVTGCRLRRSIEKECTTENAEDTEGFGEKLCGSVLQPASTGFLASLRMTASVIGTSEDPKNPGRNSVGPALRPASTGAVRLACGSLRPGFFASLRMTAAGANSLRPCRSRGGGRGRRLARRFWDRRRCIRRRPSGGRCGGCSPSSGVR